MSGVNIPVDSTHLSDQAIADMIEQYGGAVDSQFAKKSMMRNFVNVRSVKGTDFDAAVDTRRRLKPRSPAATRKPVPERSKPLRPQSPRSEPPPCSAESR